MSQTLPLTRNLQVMPIHCLVLPRQLVLKSNILLQLKGGTSTSQSFPLKWNGKTNTPGSLAQILYSECMFCGTCEKWGNPPAGSAGAWTTRGVTDWNHGTELLKHVHSQWHRDAAGTAAMAQQVESGKSVLEVQCASAALEAAERRQRNRDVL